MKFNFRKIASAVASTALIGSTIALAAAANYPAPFVQNKVADIGVVYGASSQPSDLVSAANIQKDLSDALAGQSGNGGGVPTGGDFVLLAKPSDNLNLNNTISGVFGTSVDSDDLENLLADGIYSNDENTEYDFDQKITLGSELQVNFFADSDYNNEEPTVGINMSGTQVVLNYTLNFVDQPQSDVSGGDLVDFETTTLPILGRSYFVLDADNATNVKLTLLDAANTALITEGETVTVNAGSKPYEVKIAFVGTSEVKMEVNGETTNSLAEGGTQKLSDGSYIGIKDILVQDYQGGIKRVEFSIGSGKLELTNGQSVKLNDDTVSEIVSYITRSAGGSREGISKVVLEWKTDDDAFITADSSLEMPGFKAVKFTADNFFVKSKETTTVKNSGSNNMELSVELKDGMIKVPFLFANASGEFTHIGESATEQLLTGLGTAGLLYNRSTHDYLVASWNNSRDAESYILRFETFTEDTGVNKTTPEKLTSNGLWVSACGEKTDSGGSTPTCDIGSLSLTINSINAKDSTGGKYVNFTGNAGSSFSRLYTVGGLTIYMPYTDYATATARGAINFTDNATAHPAGHSSNSFFLLSMEADKDGNLGVGAELNVTVDDQADGDLEVSAVTAPRAEQHKSLEDDDNLVGRVESDLATEFWRYGSSTAQRYAEIIYSTEESYLNAYIAAPDTTLSGGDSTLGENVIVTDAQVSSVSSKNLIVVGGSCVNTVAASLLGSSSPLCGAGFTSASGVSPGGFLIKSYESPFATGKIATLVAGYEAGDTTNAATFLTTETVITDAGTAYSGTSATEATLI